MNQSRFYFRRRQSGRSPLAPVYRRLSAAPGDLVEPIILDHVIITSIWLLRRRVARRGAFVEQSLAARKSNPSYYDLAMYCAELVDVP